MQSEKPIAKNWPAERFSRRYFRNMGAILMAGWFGFNGAVRLSEPELYSLTLSPNPLTAANKMRAYLSDKDCPPAPRNVRQSVDLAISSHRSKRNPESSSRTSFEFADSHDYVKELEAATDSSKAVEIFNSYSEADFGFPARMSPAAEEYLVNPANSLEYDKQSIGSAAEFLTAVQLEQKSSFEHFKFGLADLMKQLRFMPKQLVALSGISSLEIVTAEQLTDASNTGMTTAADSNRFNGHVRLSLNTLASGEAGRIFAHETGHLLDNNVCGLLGAERDKSYPALNTFSFEYGDYNANKPNPYGMERNVVSDYGASSPTEDKAELYSFLLTGAVSYEDLRKAPEPLKSKAELLLARLENRLPGIANYLLSHRGV